MVRKKTIYISKHSLKGEIKLAFRAPNKIMTTTAIGPTDAAVCGLGAVIDTIRPRPTAINTTRKKVKINFANFSPSPPPSLQVKAAQKTICAVIIY